MKCFLYLSIMLLMFGCGNRHETHNNINPTDSAWIDTLNKIVFPVKQDSLINVYFKYNQIVNGYEVTARWMPFEPHSETGCVIMNFRHTTSGQTLQYVENIYHNFDMDEITFSKGFKGYQNGDVYYLDYITNENPDEYKDSPLYYYAPFQFYDVDFDGEQELLINDCDQIKGGNTYRAYKVGENDIEQMDYVPFNTLDNEVTFDKPNKKIRLHYFDGVFDSSSIVFSKCPTIISNKGIPQGLSQGWTTSRQILEEYYNQDKTDFRLDSIYQNFHYTERDSVFIYAMTNRGLILVAKRDYLH